MSKAIFLDRDGVINELVERDGGYYSPIDFSEFKFKNGIAEFLKSLKNLGYLLIVVSNQPDIAREKMRKSELEKMTRYMYCHLPIDDIYYCLHDDPCDAGCRKPAPGMIIDAKNKWNIRIEKSFMIGDTWKDIEAAKNAKVRFVLLDSQHNKDIKNVERINMINFLRKTELINN